MPCWQAATRARGPCTCTRWRRATCPSRPTSGPPPAATSSIRQGDVRFGQDAIHQVWLDGKKFFLPLGWSLSYRSMRTISSSTASSLAAQLVEAELEGRDTDELKGRKTKPKVAEQ